MGVRSYVKGVAAEAALCLIASVSLIVVVLQGFVVDPALHFNLVLIGVLSALLLGVQFAAAYRRSNLVWGIVAYALLSVAVVGVGIATSTGEDIMADVAENHLSFAMTTVVANLAVFLLSRRRLGFFFLLGGGLFSCAYVEFIYHAGLTLPSIAFVLATAALFVYRTYSESVYAADSVTQVDYPRVAATACGASALCGLLALGVYFAIIAPLDPGHLSVKLFREYRAFETVEVSNSVKINWVEDPELTTQELTDEIIYGSIPIEVDGDGLSKGATGNYVENAREVIGKAEAYTLEPQDEGVDLYTFELPEFWWLLLIALLVVLVVAVVLVRRHMRFRRRSRILALEPCAQISALYDELARRLGVLGLGRPDMQTPYEFAEGASARLAIFAQGTGGASWEAVSDAYVKAHYGGIEPNGEQIVSCWRFYDRFCENALRMVGWPKYCLKYFWRL